MKFEGEAHGEAPFHHDATRPAFAAIRQGADQDAANRLRFLVVVDGRECTNRVVDFVTAVAQERTRN